MSIFQEDCHQKICCCWTKNMNICFLLLPNQVCCYLRKKWPNIFCHIFAQLSITRGLLLILSITFVVGCSIFLRDMILVKSLLSSALPVEHNIMFFLCSALNLLIS